MSKRCWMLILLGSIVTLTMGQVPSPDSYLGNPLGSQFSRHHQIAGYFQTVARNSPKVQMQPYGQTYEGRPLMLAIVSSAENIQNIEKNR